MESVIKLLKGVEETQEGVAPWDPNTQKLWNEGKVKSPALSFCSRVRYGSVVVATATYGKQGTIGTRRWDPTTDCTGCNQMWIILVLVGDELRTHHSVEIGGVKVVQVVGESSRFFLVHLFYYGDVLLLSADGEFLGASNVPEGLRTRLVSTGGALPKLEWKGDGRRNRWKDAKEWVTPDQGASLGFGLPMPVGVEGI